MGEIKSLPPGELTVVVEPQQKHTQTIIWLHGLGSSGPGWLFLVNGLAPKLPHCRWVLPTAPKRMVGGQLVNGWCACPPPPTADTPEPWRRLPFDMTQPEDQEGMLDSVRTITKIVDEEARRNDIGYERVVVAGFSQGGLTSLLTGLTSKHKLAGVACCSGWLGLAQNDRINGLLSPLAKDLPIFWGHGEDDEVIGFWMATMSLEALEKLGIKEHLEFHKYPKQTHVVSEVEMGHFVEWLEKTVKF